MAKYRIVKMRGLEEYNYKVQKKVLCWWFDTYWKNNTLNSCEEFVQYKLNSEKAKKDNPHDIVVKTY